MADDGAPGARLRTTSGDTVATTAAGRPRAIAPRARERRPGSLSRPARRRSRAPSAGARCRANGRRTRAPRRRGRPSGRCRAAPPRRRAACARARRAGPRRPHWDRARAEPPPASRPPTRAAARAPTRTRRAARTAASNATTIAIATPGMHDRQVPPHRPRLVGRDARAHDVQHRDRNDDQEHGGRRGVAAPEPPARGRSRPANATNIAAIPKYAENQCSDRLKCQLLTARRNRFDVTPETTTGRSRCGSGRRK